MSLTQQQIEDTVRGVLADVAPEIEVDLLDPKRNFRDQTELDSMDFLNLVIGLQSKLELQISELDFPRLSSLQGCVNYLCERLGVPQETPA